MRMGAIVAMVAILGVVLMMGLSHVLAGEDHELAETLTGTVAVVGVLVGLFAAVLFAVGQWMCNAVPLESRARGLAKASVISLFASVACATIVILMVVSRWGDGASAALLLLLAVGFGMTAHVMVVLCIRAIARHLGDERVAFSAGTYLKVSLIFMLCCVATPLPLGIVAFADRAREPSPAFAMLIAVMALGLLVFAVFVALSFAELLTHTRAAIGRQELSHL